MNRAGRCAGVLLGLAIGARAMVVHACGGCVGHGPPNPPPPPPPVVVWHRMVLAPGVAHTTLWDQFGYAGPPGEFMWVLPVGDSTGIEVALADPTFVTALDYLSAPGVACVAGNGRLSGITGMLDVPGSLVHAHANSVGPYRVEIVAAGPNGHGMSDFVAREGTNVPDATRATIADYERHGSDFLVVQLRPGEGTDAMQPLRVRFRGPVTTLPLRMVASGIADFVDVTLMVLGTDQWEPVQHYDPAPMLSLRGPDGGGVNALATLGAASLAGGGEWLLASALHVSDDDLVEATGLAPFSPLARSRVDALPAGELDRDANAADANGAAGDVADVVARAVDAGTDAGEAATPPVPDIDTPGSWDPGAYGTTGGNVSTLDLSHGPWVLGAESATPVAPDDAVYALRSVGTPPALRDGSVFTRSTRRWALTRLFARLPVGGLRSDLQLRVTEHPTLSEPVPCPPPDAGAYDGGARLAVRTPGCACSTAPAEPVRPSSVLVAAMLALVAARRRRALAA